MHDKREATIFIASCLTNNFMYFSSFVMVNLIRLPLLSLFDDVKFTMNQLTLSHVTHAEQQTREDDRVHLI